jgi:hypothetical protein
VIFIQIRDFHTNMALNPKKVCHPLPGSIKLMRCPHLKGTIFGK